MFFKIGVLKNFANFIGKHPEAATRGVLQKGLLRNFAKFTGKHLYQGLLFNKVVD